MGGRREVQGGGYDAVARAIRAQDAVGGVIGADILMGTAEWRVPDHGGATWSSAATEGLSYSERTSYRPLQK